MCTSSLRNNIITLKLLTPLIKVIFQDAGDFPIHRAVIKQTFYSTFYYINHLHNTAHKLLMSIEALKSPFLLVELQLQGK
jgi:hypothetical protein